MEREKNNKEQEPEQKSDFSAEKNKIPSLKFKNSLISSSFDKQFIKSISFHDNKLMSKDDTSNNNTINQNKKCKSNISDHQIYLNNRLKDHRQNTFDVNNKSNNAKNKTQDKPFINLIKNSSSPNLLNNGGNLNYKGLDKNKSDLKTGDNSFMENQDSPQILNLNESPNRLKI